MKKLSLLLLTLALVLGLAAMAQAQSSTLTKTYTWTLVTSPEAVGLWPNEANSKNIFEANVGLLGRVVTQTTANGTSTDDTPVTNPNLANVNGATNRCELAPSYPCSSSPAQPPQFLLATNCCEPVVNAPTECNRATNACGTAPPVGPGDGGHAGGLANLGAYSYLVIHRTAAGTSDKGIAFLSGSFQTIASAYGCNSCPPTGQGKDKVGIVSPGPAGDPNAACTGAGTPSLCCTAAGAGTCRKTLSQYCTAASAPSPCCTGNGTGTCDVTGVAVDNIALSNTTGDAIVSSGLIDIWTTEALAGAGHDHITLTSGGAGAGQVSICGGGVAFQTIDNDLCNVAGAVNFTIPNQKVVTQVYSVDVANNQANFANPGRCNPPDCYVEKVIIPAALNANAAAKFVQVQNATSVLPSTAPLGLDNATVDTITFSYTTDQLDIDGDSVIDPLDACPNDSTNKCIVATNTNACTGINCAAGQVACPDTTGICVCQDASLCNQRMDVDQNCLDQVADTSALKGFDTAGSNAACTGAGTPSTCCTGAGTGTCGQYTNPRHFGFAGRPTGPFFSP